MGLNAITQDEIFFRPLRDIAQMIRARSISAAELVEAMLNRLEAIEPALHSFISIDADGATRQAQHADNTLRRGEPCGLLHGVPLSVKDQFAVRGQPATLASKVFADYVPDFDADVVARVKDAGAVILGKANMYELATGWGVEGFFPIATNPWDPAHSPGGSSSGSAAGVAAGVSYASLASDGGGSTRVPAAYCGVVGIKPTFGCVSYGGSLPRSIEVHGRQVAISKTINSAGVIARTVEDAAIVLAAITTGAAPSTRQEADVFGPADDSLRGVVVGVPRDYVDFELDPEMRDGFEAALALLGEAGADIEEVVFPASSDEIAWMWMTIAYVEMVGSLHDAFKQRPEDFSPELRLRLSAGEKTIALDYFRAAQARASFRSDLADVLRNVNVLATPTVPAAAPSMYELKERSQSLEEVGRLARFTRPYNLSGFPAVSVPCGFTTSGLPLGLQLGAAPSQEPTVLKVAETYQQRTGWHLRHPAFPSASLAGAAATRANEGFEASSHEDRGRAL
jgi:Asp-tRNA(Asn)/Glu-tRNA(Gln) amidotransferase A subunit family amidase